MTNTNATTALGAAATVMLWAITALSDRFGSFPQGLAEMPVIETVALLCASAVFYLGAVRFAGRESGALPFALVFGIGILMRAAGLFASPVLEDDYFRYLWDGAVAAKGINPYLFSPSEAVTGEAGDALEVLAAQSGEVVWRVNHPYLKTIYPPATQAFFALSNVISEWSVGVWRLVLLTADVATFFILRAMGGNKTNPVIYWWNPLVVFAFFFSCHFDALVFPFVLGALAATRKNRGNLAVLLLSVSVSVKLWTAALIAPLVRGAGGGAKKTLALIALFAASATAMLSPLLFYGLGENSGLAAYAESWENNSSFFRLNLLASRNMAELAGFHPGYGQIAARISTAVIITLGAAYGFFSNRWKSDDTAGRFLFVSALVFLVLPTQFPWYYCWIVPFLALRKDGAKWSLLVLTALLPLYYTKYRIEQPENGGLFDGLIVWIEFVPVWIMLFFEQIRSKTAVRLKDEV